MNNNKLTPARIAMIRALKMATAGNINLAKRELKKAEKELNKQYKKND